MRVESEGGLQGFPELVNTCNPIQRVPEAGELVCFPGALPGVRLLEEPARQLSRLLAQLDCADQIIAVSGFRSIEEQATLYAGALAEHGEAFTRSFVALPGRSEHHTGLAVDMALNEGEIDEICPAFPYTGICGRFRALAPQFGFIERYPAGKTAVTGYAHEPWHFRYVGCAHALSITQKGQTLEEYLEELKHG